MPSTPLATKRSTATVSTACAQLLDLDLELGHLLGEALPVEFEQGLLRFGREERLGRVVGALAGRGDLGRGLLGRILVGLGDERRGS